MEEQQFRELQEAAARQRRENKEFRQKMKQQERGSACVIGTGSARRAASGPPCSDALDTEIRKASRPTSRGSELPRSPSLGPVGGNAFYGGYHVSSEHSSASKPQSRPITGVGRN